jgi:hypothetical protein
MAWSSVVSTVVGAGASYYSAKKASEAQQEASQQGINAQQGASDTNLKIYNQQRADQEPFRQAGLRSLADFQRMLTGGYNMQESPAAQYASQQGTRSLNRQLAARGGLGGGNAAQRLAELNSGIAANDWNNQYTRLLDALKLGTGASASMGTAGQNYASGQRGIANSLSDLYGQQGESRASLYAGLPGMLGNALTTGLNMKDYTNSQDTPYTYDNSYYNYTPYNYTNEGSQSLNRNSGV